MNKAKAVEQYWATNWVLIRRNGTCNIIDFTDSLAEFNDSVEIYNETWGTGRWESQEFTVFRLSDDSMVGIEHSEGLTEYQDSTGVTDVYEVDRREVMTWEYFRAE